MDQEKKCNANLMKKMNEYALNESETLNKFNPFKGQKEEKISYFFAFFDENDSYIVTCLKWIFFFTFWPFISIYLFIDLILLEILIVIIYVVYMILDMIFEQFLKLYVIVVYNKASNRFSKIVDQNLKKSKYQKQ